MLATPEMSHRQCIYIHACRESNSRALQAVIQ